VLKLLRVLICATALSGIVFTLTAQDQQPSQPKTENPQDTFFSGNVVSVTSDKLTVARRTLGLTTVTRVFLRDANTQVEGKSLQAKARVTVKFEKTDDGDRAVRIIVR
jgi:hypothetical protein